MKWKTPPLIKIYEALGCIGDNRLEINGLEGKVYSSSKGKFYSIRYEPKSNSIMCNDNGSYYVGYLGYPAIAYLMQKGELDFKEIYSTALKGIYWKDLNMKHNRNKGGGVPDYDFNAVIKEVDVLIQEKGVNLTEFRNYLEGVLEQIKSKNLNILGEKELPPVGY